MNMEIIVISSDSDSEGNMKASKSRKKRKVEEEDTSATDEGGPVTGKQHTKSVNKPFMF